MGKRVANELACSGDSSEPANRRPTPSEGSAPLHASAPAVTSDQAASCSRQLGPPGCGSTYADVLAGSVVPFQASGSFKPTAMGSDPSEPAVSSDAVNERMSSDMSGPLSDMPVGNATHTEVTNVLIRRPFLFQVYVTPVPSWLGGEPPSTATWQIFTLNEG